MNQQATSPPSGADTRLNTVATYQADHDGYSVDTVVETTGGTFHRVRATRINDDGTAAHYSRNFHGRNARGRALSHAAFVRGAKWSEFSSQEIKS